MRYLNKTEHPSDVTYTAVEMAALSDQKPQESRLTGENRFELIKTPLNVIRRQWTQNGTVKLMLLALGIFISYVIVGILQETIMRGKYRNEEQKCERFTFAASLVFVQFIFSYSFIKALDLIKPEGKDETHFGYYACSALANVSAMVTSYAALRWVTYAMQVILKSAKPISVMFGGLLFCRRYKIQRYLFVLIIVIGVAMFMYFESKEGKEAKTDDCKTESSSGSHSIDASDKQLFGIGLLIVSLVMDGILGGILDKIRDRYSPSSRQFMIAVSAWGAIILLIYTVATGEIFYLYKFTHRHPIILFHMALHSIVGVIGQLFIFTVISSFGPLSCSITTTVRKFFSVLFSIVFFGNTSTPLQWVGAILIFAGLLADAVFGMERSSHNESAEADKEMDPIEKLTDSPGHKIEITKSSSKNQDGKNEV